MSSPLLVAAAESSKTAFYILGGLLVVWAVGLAGLGLNRPKFPGGAGGQRGVIAVTLVLMILALAAAITSG